MNVQAYKANSYPVSRPAPRNSGPDDVHDEFDNRRSNDGPDAVVDEFNHSRYDSSYNSYDSWSGGSDSGCTYGGLI